MSYKTKAEAAAAGRAAIASLPETRGWTLRTWENLGWHYGLHNGPVSIYEGFESPGGQYRYHAMIARDVDTAGTGDIVWSGENTHAATPAACVLQAIRRVREYTAAERDRLAKMEAFLDALEPTLRKHKKAAK
jgi:hypothetical protein